MEDHAILGMGHKSPQTPVVRCQHGRRGHLHLGSIQQELDKLPHPQLLMLGALPRKHMQLGAEELLALGSSLNEQEELALKELSHSSLLVLGAFPFSVMCPASSGDRAGGSQVWDPELPLARSNQLGRWWLYPRP